MPKQRTPVSKIKDVLRLKFDCHLPNRSIAACLNVGCATISEVITRFRASELAWPLPDGLTDNQLESWFYQGRRPVLNKRMPDFGLCHQELRRKGMTKLLLSQEYQHDEPDTACGYTQFCVLYRDWVKKQKRSMRQLHMAGEKLFLDYCGPTVPVINPDTGVIRHAQIFVATLGASNYTYIEASPAQDQESGPLGSSAACRSCLCLIIFAPRLKRRTATIRYLMRTIRSLCDTTTPLCCLPGPIIRRTKQSDCHGCQNPLALKTPRSSCPVFPC